MTLAFTFPIKDAWVIVADRLLIGKEGEYNFKEFEEERMRLDNLSKIEHLPSKDLVFVGAGHSELLDIFIEKINLKEDLTKFKKDFELICSSLSTGKFEISVKSTEFLIIDKKNLKVFHFLDGKTKEIRTCEQGFIGSLDNLKNLNDAKADLKRREDYTFDPKDSGAILEFIYTLEKLAKQKLSQVGHPAIDGCDIWIITKEKIITMSVSPKKYIWDEKEK